MNQVTVYEHSLSNFMELASELGINRFIVHIRERNIDGNDPECGKHAITEYRFVDRGDGYNLVHQDFVYGLDDGNYLCMSSCHKEYI